jgi:hypothetical protein
MLFDLFSTDSSDHLVKIDLNGAKGQVGWTKIIAVVQKEGTADASEE